MHKLFAAFLTGLFIGAFALSVSAQNWDLPGEFKLLREAIDALTMKMDKLSATLSVDGEVGKPAPKTGPVLMLVGPDGNVLPAQAGRDGRLRVAVP